MAQTQLPSYLLCPLDTPIDPDTKLKLGILLPPCSSSSSLPQPLLPFDSEPHIYPPESVISRKVETPPDPSPEAAAAAAAAASKEAGEHGWTWNGTVQSERSGTFSFSIPFLASEAAGAHLSKGRTRTSSTRIRCRRVETESFDLDPKRDLDYVAEKLKDPEVRQFVRKRRGIAWRRPPVYMVTGIKVAHDARIEFARENEGGVDAGFNASIGGGTVQAAIDGERHTSEEYRQQGLYRAGPFVLGYRVVRLRLSRDFDAKIEAFEGRGVLMNDEQGKVDILDKQWLEDFWDIEEVGLETRLEGKEDG